LARKIRKALERGIGKNYSDLTGLVEEVRREVKKRGIRVDGDGWQAALDLDIIVGLLTNGHRAKAKEWLLGRVERVSQKTAPDGARE